MSVEDDRDAQEAAYAKNIKKRVMGEATRAWDRILRILGPVYEIEDDNLRHEAVKATIYCYRLFVRGYTVPPSSSKKRDRLVKQARGGGSASSNENEVEYPVREALPQPETLRRLFFPGLIKLSYFCVRWDMLGEVVEDVLEGDDDDDGRKHVVKRRRSEVHAKRLQAFVAFYKNPVANTHKKQLESVIRWDEGFCSLYTPKAKGGAKPSSNVNMLFNRSFIGLVKRVMNEGTNDKDGKETSLQQRCRRQGMR
eukprot:jgi/Bigna1/66463/fgenesh1_pg.1_\